MNTIAGPYGTQLVGPYGVELAGPYGVQLAQATESKKTLGLYNWQWLFVGGAALLTATGAFVAHYKAKPKGKSTKAAAVGGIGGALAGGLFAYALGKA